MKIDWGEFQHTIYFCDEPKNKDEPRAWRRTSQFGEWELTYDPDWMDRGKAFVLHNATICLVGSGNSEDDAVADFFKRLEKRIAFEQNILEQYMNSRNT